MAISVGGDDAEDGAINDINTTPLVDVMLVLLIIFLIAVPVALQTAPVALPKQSSVPTETKPENLVISVDKDGNVYWLAKRLEGGKKEMHERVKTAVIAAVKKGLPIPEVHIRADKDTPFQFIGGVIFNVQTAGIQKVGFISEPSVGEGGRRF